MKRIAYIPVEFGKKIYDFKLYFRTLLVIGDKVKIEYTEKVCNEIVRIYEMDHKQSAVKACIEAEQNAYVERIMGRIESWEKEHEKGENDE